MSHIKIIRTLCDLGFPTYIAGGAVRDILSGKEPKDFDVTTKATPVELKKIFKKRCTLPVGKTFGVVIIDGIEVATFREDRYDVLYNAKNCIVKYAETIHEDLSRRDLTINALAMCAFTGDLIDNHEGVFDLERKLIRFVGDASLRIKEDPDRIIRACRFLAKIEGRFDNDTFKVLKEHAHFIKDYVSPERIRLEILKAMELEVPSLFFSALHLIGALKYIFPEMDSCFNHQHGKYHIETISEHVLSAGDVVSVKFPLVRLAAFLHDVGKPMAFLKMANGSFVCHELYGGIAVERSLKRLKFSKKEVHTIAQLVYCHMLQYRSLKPKGVRKLQKKLADADIDPKSYLRIKIADRSSNMSKGKIRISPIKDLLINAGIWGVEEEIPFVVTSLALSGGDLIKLFSLTPGPLVGELQRHLLNYVVEVGEEFNEVTALKEEASRFLEALKNK
jgi:tRNA nucleotidyltransferase (CCA-adding enzyme)